MTVEYFGEVGSPPYSVYAYPPSDELAVRREMRDLQAFLHAHRVDTAAISLADLFWQAVDESGFYGSLVDTERGGPDDPYVQDQVRTSLHEILSGEPSLADRVLQATEEEPPQCAVILYRAGALYPVFRTSALLDDLRERLKRPVTLLYPGTVIQPHGLSFMGSCEAVHGYRAQIFDRNGA